jgi:acyl-coenzyme A thioesterase PaaI-like protein
MKSKELPATVEERIEIFNSCDYARLLGIEIVEVWDGGARAVMDGTNKKTHLEQFMELPYLLLLIKHLLSLRTGKVSSK